MSYNEAKKKIRQKVGQQVAQLTPEEHQVKSSEISEKLITCCSELFTSQRNVLFTYLPFRTEVDIRPLIEWCWKQGIRVAVPKTASNRTMRLHIISDFTETEKGAMGIPEPLDSTLLLEDLSQIGAVLVPGVAFDRTLGRLGYGGGYYDRFFEDVRKRCGSLPKLIAAAFDVQVLDEVPMEEHDVRVDRLFTESRNWTR